MNKLNFSYKKFNTSNIEHFSIPKQSMTQIKQQLREILDVEIYNFNLINPGHTFRELNLILNSDYLPWYGNSKHVYSHAHSYLKDGYLSADSILKFNETIDPILGEKIIVNEGYFSNKDIKIVFPWNSGNVSDITQSGSQVGDQSNSTGVHCYVIRPAPGDGAPGEFVNYDVDDPIEDFIIFVDYSNKIKPPLVKSIRNSDNETPTKTPPYTFAPPVKPIKPFLDKMTKCLKQYKYEFIISAEKHVNLSNPSIALRIKNFRVNNSKISSGRIKLNQDTIATNTDIGSNNWVRFEAGADRIGKSLFTVTTDGKVNSFSMTFFRQSESPGLNILENNISILNETENRGSGNQGILIANYDLSEFNDYPEELAPAQLEYYVAKHGYLFTNDTDTYPEKLEKGREHWSSYGRENKLSWSPLFEPCHSKDIELAPSPQASKVYFGDLDERERNYMKIQHGTDPNFDTDPEALTEGSKSKCMIRIDYQKQGPGKNFNSLPSNHYFKRQNLSSLINSGDNGPGFFDHALYAGEAGSSSENPTQEDCNKAKLYWKNLANPLKVTSDYKASGINKGNLVEDIISSNPDDWYDELSKDQRIRIDKMKENITNNNTLAIKAFESLARRDQQANEHYEIVEKTSAIQMQELERQRKKIEKKYNDNKIGLDKISTDSRKVVVDQEKESDRKKIQNIFIYIMVILSALILISIGLSKS